jgi:hypothetical protein
MGKAPHAFRAAVVAVASLAIACGLSAEGTGSPAASSSDASVVTDASASSAQDANGTNGAGGACADAGRNGANGSMTAHEATTAPVVDGDLSEWSCATPFVLDPTSAGYTSGTANSTAALALTWTTDTLYFAAKVTDGKIAGTNTSDPWHNDAVELYVGSGAEMGTYSPSDWHFIVDYNGFARAYQGSMTFSTLQGFASAAKRTASGFVVEMSVSASLLGMTSFAMGTSLGFDVQLDDCEDSAADRAGYLDYWVASGQPACPGCTNCGTMEPYCDTYAFGKVALVSP